MKQLLIYLALFCFSSHGMAFESIKERFEKHTISKELKTIESDLAESFKDDDNPFLSDSKVILHSRTYLMDHDRDSEPYTSRKRYDRYSFATGGWIGFKSGYYKDWLGLGLTQYGSYKLDGNRYGDRALLLESDQHSINVLGEAYIELLHSQGNVKVYRQKINTPFINSNDNRMVPQTFEAFKFSSNKNSKVDYILVYADKIKSRNSNSFENINGSVNNDGVWSAGLRYRFMEALRTGFITYYAQDYLDVHYAELDGSREINSNSAINYSFQYIQQDSTGNEDGGNIDTHAWGVRFNYQFNQWQLFFTYTDVDSNDGIISPWGSYPGYNSVQINDFNRAGEEALGLGLSYHFSDYGLKGLTSSIKFISGDTPDKDHNASSDQIEYNIDVQYVLQKGLLEGLSLRLRYADVERSSYTSLSEGYLTGLDENQFRFIMNYDIQL